MGVLTEIIIADHFESEQLADAINPTETWEGIDAKGIDPVKLGKLYAILSGCEFEATIPIFDQLAGGDEGPWVLKTPPDRPDLLTAMTDPDPVAQQWAATEEFQLDGWPLDAVKETLSKLTRLAARSKELGKPLIMWMSL